MHVLAPPLPGGSFRGSPEMRVSRPAIRSRPFMVSGSKGSVERETMNDAGQYAEDFISRYEKNIQARQELGHAKT